MKNLMFSFVAASLFSPSLYALDVPDLFSSNKHALYVGGYFTMGDLSRLSDGANYLVGYDYTFDNRLLIGGFVMPDMGSYRQISSARPELKDTGALGVYLGYHLMQNIRLSAGVTLTGYKETTRSSTQVTEETKGSLGLNIGVDYIYKSLLLGTRVTTQDIDYYSGSTLGVNLGVVF